MEAKEKNFTEKHINPAYVLIISVLIVNISCKEISADAIMEKRYDDSKGLFVAMHVIVPKDDEFSLMYLTQNISNWSHKALIKKKVEGMDYVQVVSFQLDKDLIPSKIRIDLGTNTETNEIDLYKLVFRHGNSMMEVKRDLIYKYFVFNKYIDKDSKYPKLQLSEKDGKYDPIMVSTDYFNGLISVKLNL